MESVSTNVNMRLPPACDPRCCGAPSEGSATSARAAGDCVRRAHAQQETESRRARQRKCTRAISRTETDKRTAAARHARCVAFHTATPSSAAAHPIVIVTNALPHPGAVVVHLWGEVHAASRAGRHQRAHARMHARTHHEHTLLAHMTVVCARGLRCLACAPSPGDARPDPTPPPLAAHARAAAGTHTSRSSSARSRCGGRPPRLRTRHHPRRPRPRRCA